MVQWAMFATIIPVQLVWVAHGVQQMSEYKALPMSTINDNKGNPYISIIDDEYTFHIQLHRYDQTMRSKILVHLDKKCIPDLIKALEQL
jgi:hypothetical protein